MIVGDNLYGAITIPDWLSTIMLAPEVQRLRDVRLINVTSPSCPALSDVRRFTHIMGVFFLAKRLEEELYRVWSQREVRSFFVAVLLHDIGTPAFGHLFEYQLAVATGWDHEKFVEEVIRGTYRPEKIYHQIYYSNMLSLHETLNNMEIDVELVLSIIRGEGVLGKLLSGSIDLDNIDNVYRMATMLGIHPDLDQPIQIVDSIALDTDGLKFEEAAIPLLRSWIQLRRKVYEILVFDEWCLSAQAMLTSALVIAFQKEYLGQEHWALTDEELLRRLLECDEAKEIIQRFAVGEFYSRLFLGWYSLPKGSVDLRDPEYRAELVKALSEQTDIPCCPYIFYDSGTFSKELSVELIDSEGLVPLSGKSESTIAAVFTSHRSGYTNMEKMRLHDQIVEILSGFGLRDSNLIEIPDREETYGVASQKKLPF